MMPLSRCASCSADHASHYAAALIVHDIITLSLCQPPLLRHISIFRAPPLDSVIRFQARHIRQLAFISPAMMLRCYTRGFIDELISSRQLPPRRISSTCRQLPFQRLAELMPPPLFAAAIAITPLFQLSLPFIELSPLSRHFIIAIADIIRFSPMASAAYFRADLLALRHADVFRRRFRRLPMTPILLRQLIHFAQRHCAIRQLTLPASCADERCLLPFDISPAISP
jgi:hypothetical protein